MRAVKSIVILGACLVLALGITGCDDDDDLIIDPVTQGVAAATQGVVTGVNTVTALATVLAQASLLASETGVMGGLNCEFPLEDVSAEVCTGGAGTAETCDLPPFIDLLGCNVTGVGVLEGTPAAFLSDPTTVELNLTIDGNTFMFGTLFIAQTAAAGQMCFPFFYDVTVTNGTSSTIVGSIIGCDDGSITGSPVVTIAELNLQMFFEFLGNSATVDVFDLSTQTVVAVCTISPLNGTPNCSAPPLG